MRPEIRRMILEDRRILSAFTTNGGTVWDRRWPDLFDGYDHETMMELPTDAWLRFEYEDGGHLVQGAVALSRYVVHGLGEEES